MNQRPEDQERDKGAMAQASALGQNAHDTPPVQEGITKQNRDAQPEINPGIKMPEGPQMELPKGGGAIRGIGEKFEANPVTGSGSFSVPLAMTEGRGGFSPALALAYNSGAGNSPFGLGWNIGLPHIVRKTDKGLPKYADSDESDTFLMSGAEDLVPLLEDDGSGNWTRYSRTDGNYKVTRYRPRIEGLFAIIERWQHTSTRISHWKTITRDNITSIYGQSSHARIADPEDTTKVFRWNLEKTWDDRGNVIEFEYKEEDGAGLDSTQIFEKGRTGLADYPARYLKQVRYGNTEMHDGSGNLSGSNDWLFWLVFDYGEHDSADPEVDPTAGMGWDVRQDPYSNFKPGFDWRHWRLCKRILMFHKIAELKDDGSGNAVPALVKATEITYDENPLATQLSSVQHHCYKPEADPVETQSYPPVEFTYSEAQQDETVYDLPLDDLEELPGGVGANLSWKDLDGEGIPGILADFEGAWYFKRNLGAEPPVPGNGSKVLIDFDSFSVVSEKPMPGAAQQLQDIDGDGSQEVVVHQSPLHGKFKKDHSGEWLPFEPFESNANINWEDPNLRMLDLDGDGLADVLLTTDNLFQWYRNKEGKGYEEAMRITQPFDEEQGPALVFADASQSIYTADMSGDGLTDLVRVINGSVCYWPNLGYGRFGAKITLAGDPFFDHQDSFDQKRIRMADVDGSGTADIIYLGSDKVSWWANQAGNQLSLEKEILNVPDVDNVASINVLDLLGRGTACLVWSSPLKGDHAHRVRYIDLMGQKPYLLTGILNNMGSEQKLFYTASTEFYLEDRMAGKPWKTKLPFPVQVLKRTETYDYISETRLVTRYAYHHGYYDRQEREFRGFAMVEQWDSEEIDHFGESGLFPVGTNENETYKVQPIYTKSWFHNGASPLVLSGDFSEEYFQADSQAFELPAHALPDELNSQEWHEAYRALKGKLLHSEVYHINDDGSTSDPYTVTDGNYQVKKVQPQEDNPYASFLCLSRENLSHQYEEEQGDPRVTHQLVLNTDDYGLPLLSANIAYPRRGSGHDSEQATPLVSFTEQDYIHIDDQDYARRIGIPYRIKAWQVTGLSGGSGSPHTADQLVTDFQSATSIEYDETPSSGVEKRLISQTEAEYYSNDLSSTLSLGTAESRALLKQVFQLALTADMKSNTFGSHSEVTESLLTTQGGYVKRGTDFYIPSDLPNYNSSLFYVVDSIQDAFGNDLDFTYDSYGLAVTQSEDAYSNTSNAQVDYRVMAPWEMTDPNGNRQQVAFDARGMVIKTAVMGKDGDDDGDTLDYPTTELSYNLFNWKDNGLPNFVHTKARDTHADGATAGVSGFPTIIDQVDIVVDTNAETITKDGTYGYNAGGFSQESIAGDGYVEREVGSGDNERVVCGLSYSNGGADVSTIDYNIETRPDSKVRAAQGSSWVATNQGYQVGDVLRVERDGNTIRYYQNGVQFASVTESGSGDMHVDFSLSHDNSVLYGLNFVDTGSGGSAPPSGFLESYTYTDGLGNEVLQKAKAEPGEAFIFENGELQYDGSSDPLVDDVDNNLPSGAPGTGERWVGSGRVIYNNKGLPVKQYEPYFTNSPEFEQEDEVREFGVSPLLIYDPLGRNTETQHPDGSFEKTSFNCWQQERYDRNDTVADSDWYSDRNSPSPGSSEPTDKDERAAWLAVQHHGTPRVLELDVLGRVYKMRDDNGSYDGTSVNHDFADTEFTLDIEGKQRSYTNALGQTTEFTYDMRPPGEEDGGTVIYTDAPDSGERTMLWDATGKPLMRWDERGHFFEHSYDDLQRPLGIEMTTGGSTKMVQWMVYGDNINLSSPEDDNFRGQALRVFDQSGVMKTDSVDFKGNMLSGTRQLASDYVGTIDWTTVSQQTTLANVDSQASSQLESESFTTQTTYDALNRPTLITQPDGSQHKPSYNEAGLLEKMEVQLQHEGGFTEYVLDINYDAKGQRTDIEYGNGTKTFYTYDPNTFRLTRLKTTRGNDILQDLNYTYDPVGNIVEMVDDAQQTQYFSNTVIDPKSKYTYDALYRLSTATGREKDSLPMPGASGAVPDSIPTGGKASPTLSTYCEQFTYDALGNILQLSHRDTCGGTENWKRNYQYNPNTPNNYLLSTYTGGTPPGTPQYTYDAHGNMLEMPHLSALNWDFGGQLKSSEKTDETTHYVYSGGERVRKVVLDTSGSTDKIKYERIYLGPYELYREYDSSESLDLERETHHVMDDQRKIALLEVKTVDNGTTIANGSRTTIARYQYTNHLDSACLELNENAEILSYEEYHPFGTTSYSLHTNDSEVSLKRYKYVHKERDDESGLYYYGARYYAAWLCRFVSVDPLKDKYPFYATYQYAGNKPVTFIDLDGLEEANPQERTAQQQPSGITHMSESDAPAGIIDTKRGIKAGEYTLYGVKYYEEGEVAGQYWIARRTDEEGNYSDDFVVGVDAVKEFVEDVDQYRYLANAVEWGYALGGEKGQSLFDAWKSTWTFENILTGISIGGGALVAMRPRPINVRSKSSTRTRVKADIQSDPKATPRNPAVERTSSSKQQIPNRVAGTAREALEQIDLKKKYPTATIEPESYLRNAEGKIVKDPLTETGRRIDFAVIEEGKIVDLVETTSLSSNKRFQIAKEKRIRAAGGTFIRERATGKLIDISKFETRISRRP